ncbi:MAG: alpha/beta hydrolase [Streptosporangiaceae bacterium]
MFEPQSTLLFILLVVAFAVLMWRTLAARRLAVRIAGACLVFLPAMTVGVLAVNRYYDYYQTWGAAIADFSGQAGAPAASARTELAAVTADPQARRLAQQQGYTLHLSLTGQRSHITRAVYVYLPPQYFEPAYRGYRFPVIELIHGSPGLPQDWINVVGVTRTLDSMIRQGRARPAVLLMPDANGGYQIDLQCLNQVGGPQDLTFLGTDLPDQISRLLRVQPPGRAWGIAGYSAGGYCALNMALHFRERYGFAGVLSGYYLPSDNQWGNPIRNVNPFGGNYRLAEQNNALDEVETLPPGAVLPQFWLAAGLQNPGDVQQARLMIQGLRLLQPHTPLILDRGLDHNMATWRAEVPPLLTWMTRGLAAARAPAPVRIAAARSQHGCSQCGQAKTDPKGHSAH